MFLQGITYSHAWRSYFDTMFLYKSIITCLMGSISWNLLSFFCDCILWRKVLRIWFLESVWICGVAIPIRPCFQIIRSSIVFIFLAGSPGKRTRISWPASHREITPYVDISRLYVLIVSMMAWKACCIAS